MHRSTPSSTFIRCFVYAVVIAALACDSPTAPTGPETDVVDDFRTDGVVVTAAVRALDARQIEVTLTAANETDSAAQTSILGGNCMFRPRFYAERDGRLVWSAFDLFSACQEPGRLFELAAGEEESVSREFTVGLPAGDYFVTLTIELLGLVELAAGVVSLR